MYMYIYIYIYICLYIYVIYMFVYIYVSQKCVFIISLYKENVKHISEINGFIYFITYTYILAQKKLNIFLLVQK